MTYLWFVCLIMPEYFIQEALTMIEPARKLAKKIPDANSLYWTSKLLKSVKTEDNQVIHPTLTIFLIII